MSKSLDRIHSNLFHIDQTLRTMTNETISHTVQSILIEKFDVSPENFTWDKSLEELQENFKILGNLVFLEQLLEKQFDRKFPLLEHISTAYHTPKDIVVLIMKELVLS